MSPPRAFILIGAFQASFKSANGRWTLDAHEFTGRARFLLRTARILVS